MNCFAFCKDGDKEHQWHLGTDALYGFLRVSRNRRIQSMKRATPKPAVDATLGAIWWAEVSPFPQISRCHIQPLLGCNVFL